METTPAKQRTLARIIELGLLAVIRGPSPERTVKAVEALVAGGVTGIEITYSTPDAAAVVRQLDQQLGDRIVLGMGTLTRPEQVAEAQQAGARFLVSPHCDPELAQGMVRSGLLTLIGALTPSEIMEALRLGADVVKLFPGSLGGPGYLKDLRGPFPDIPIVPTGGVDIDNVAQWFEAGAAAVGAGSALCPAALIQEGQLDAISEQARLFARAVHAARHKD